MRLFFHPDVIEVEFVLHVVYLLHCESSFSVLFMISNCNMHFSLTLHQSSGLSAHCFVDILELYDFFWTADDRLLLPCCL